MLAASDSGGTGGASWSSHDDPAGGEADGGFGSDFAGGFDPLLWMLSCSESGLPSWQEEAINTMAL